VTAKLETYQVFAC